MVLTSQEDRSRTWCWSSLWGDGAPQKGWTQWILVLENLLNATWSGVGLSLPGVGTRPRTCHLPASPRRLSACAVPAASAHLNQRNGNCLCQLGRCMHLHTAWNRV